MNKQTIRQPSLAIEMGLLMPQPEKKERKMQYQLAVKTAEEVILPHPQRHWGPSFDGQEYYGTDAVIVPYGYITGFEEYALFFHHKGVVDEIKKIPEGTIGELRWWGEYILPPLPRGVILMEE